MTLGAAPLLVVLVGLTFLGGWGYRLRLVGKGGEVPDDLGMESFVRELMEPPLTIGGLRRFWGGHRASRGSS